MIDQWSVLMIAIFSFFFFFVDLEKVDNFHILCEFVYLLCIVTADFNAIFLVCT